MQNIMHVRACVFPRVCITIF